MIGLCVCSHEMQLDFLFSDTSMLVCFATRLFVSQVVLAKNNCTTRHVFLCGVYIEGNLRVATRHGLISTIPCPCWINKTNQYVFYSRVKPIFMFGFHVFFSSFTFAYIRSYPAKLFQFDRE